MRMVDAAKLNMKTVLLRLACSFVTALFFVLGAEVDREDTAQLLSGIMWGQIILLTVICFAVVYIIGFIFRFWGLADKGRVKEPPRFLWIVAPAVFYIISLLACFPGVFSYDCYEEWKMVAENAVSNHHPALHVYLLGGLVEASTKICGTGNIGILVYVLLQIAFSLFVIYRLMKYFEESNTSGITRWISLVFVSLSPVVLMFIIATTKDTLFSMFELWFIVSGLRILREDSLMLMVSKLDSAAADDDMPKPNITKSHTAELIVSAVGTMIFRKNGLYIAIAALIILVILVKKFRKRMLLIAGISIAIYAVYALGICNIVGVKKGSSAEMLSVPIQQLSRTYKYSYDELSDSQRSEITEYMPAEYIEKYIPTTADSVKMGFNSELFDKDPLRFIKLWGSVGIKHPLSYINAFLANTVDYWYPLAKVDGYRWLYGNDENKSNFFDYRVAEPGKQVVIVGPVHVLFEKLATDLTVTQTIFPSVLLNPGWYILFWIWSMVFAAKNRRMKVFFNAVMLLSLLTVLAGPMALVRYVLIFYFALPIEIDFMAKGIVK